MAARIYQRAKSSMQSGRARAREWMLVFEPAEAKVPDPLTGWAGSGDTRDQIQLRFETLEAAQAYAKAHDIEARVVPPTASSSGWEGSRPRRSMSCSKGRKRSIGPPGFPRTASFRSKAARTNHSFPASPPAKAS